MYVPMLQNTFILKRRFPPELTKKGSFPEKMKHRHFIYDLVDENFTKPQKNVRILLRQYVAGENITFRLHRDTLTFAVGLAASVHSVDSK